jgi:acetyl-CoA carboxylase biotin carboxyl carrier protein
MESIMGTWNHSYDEEFQGDESSRNGEHSTDERISVEQLQRLVHLLDKSDVSEIELKRESGDMRLVLRKAKASDAFVAAAQSTLIASQQSMNGFANGASGATGASVDATPVPDTKHSVRATLVGVFHVWAKPKGGVLVAVGDKVKAGQLVGTIQSLNVINEVETQFAGRVVEILVQDGQPVEYGQHLMTVDSAE